MSKQVMTKEELTKELRKRLREREGLPLTNKQARAVINTLLEVIKESIQAGKEIRLRKFGTFYPRERRYNSPLRGRWYRGSFKTIGLRAVRW